MGGGDLNLKKSWHPLLMKNQERVWKEERKAIDERKRTQQLLKEKAEERQIEELQKMGGKREERVDWLYAAPASGSGQNEEELEQYLLGKKSVEQLFREKDRKKMEALANGAAGGAAAQGTVTPGNFQALGNNANTMRDMASKIREDPLLAIKKQEQRAYEELMKNPARLKELRAAREAANGSTSSKKERKHKHKHGREDETEEERAERRKRRKEEKHRDEEYDRRPLRRDEDERRPARRDYRSDEEDRKPSYRQRSRSPPARRSHYDAEPRRQSYAAYVPPPQLSAEEREAKLAAMSAAAHSMHSSRNERLVKQEAEDREIAEREDKERLARKVKGGAILDPKFVKDQQKQMWDKKVEGRH